MENTTVISTLLQHLHVENHKILSLLNATYREVFMRRRYLGSMKLVVYSHEQLEDVKTSVRLLENVQHLQILVTKKCDDAAEVSQTAQQFVVETISEVAKVARLASISVAWCNLNVENVLDMHNESQTGQYRAQLMQIPAEKLAALSSLNFSPFGVLREAFVTLLNMAPGIETLDFRNQSSRWIVSRDHSQWLATTCGLIGLQDLVEIREYCRNLRRLFGIRIDEKAMPVLETFAKSLIKLTDVYIVHSGLEEQLFCRFLRSQPTLVNVFIYDTRRNTLPVSLYEIAKDTLVNLRKFDVYGLPPVGNGTTEDGTATAIVSNMKMLSKVRIDSSLRYNFTEPSQLQRIAFRCIDPKRWVLYLPWTVMHGLTTLSLNKVLFTHHNIDLLRCACPLLAKLCLKTCYFESDRALIILSRMKMLSKLSVVNCQVKDMSPPYTSFPMPQLRRLHIFVDFSDALQQATLAFVHNAPNLVRLTLMDFSPSDRNVDVSATAWLHDLKQLRWLSTNVHRRRESTVTFDLSCFPMLERLCVIPRSHGSATQFVRLEILGTDRQAIFTGDGQVGQLCVLFVHKPQSSFGWLQVARR